MSVETRGGGCGLELLPKARTICGRSRVGGYVIKGRFPFRRLRSAMNRHPTRARFCLIAWLPGLNFLMEPGVGDLLAGIVVRIQIFESQRTNGRYLSDVFARLCPVKMRRIAGQNNDATGWISLHLIAIEPIAEPDVENAGHDCVDPVLGVSVRHQLHTGGHF